jgi:O-antigen/teichoic acid export membrane protein
VQIGLGRNVIASMGTALLWIGSALLTVPLILDAVGTAGFGVWTIALSIIIFIGVAESGLGTGILRFTAVARGEEASADIARVAWTSIALYLLVGLVLVGLTQVLAPSFTSAFDIPERLEGDAEEMFRITGLVMLAALLVAGLGNVQQGLERFEAYAVTTGIGLASQVMALVILLPDAGLPGVAWAALVQQAMMGIGRAWTLRQVFIGARPGLLGAARTRELVGYSLRMQMSALSTFVNNQSDKLVVGVIASASTTGQLGIASQVAEAGRVVAGQAVNPFVSRMAATHGRGDDDALTALYIRLDRLWKLTVMGATAIALAAMYPLIESWLGSGHDEAALLAGFLVVAFSINLLPGVGTAYLRAIGRPGIEARYGGLVILLNFAFTVPLGLAGGARGVVAGTTCAYALGTLWYWAQVRRFAPETPDRMLGSPLRLAAIMIATSAAALGWGLAMNALLPPGFALLPVAAGVGAALIVHLSATTGVRPTLANARALLA